MKKFYYACDLEEAKKRIASSDVSIAVIGQGKMGLPISAALLQKGYVVYGVDNNHGLIERIKEGTFRTNEPSVHETISGEYGLRYSITSELGMIIKLVDIIIIVIPVGVSHDLVHGHYIKGLHEFRQLMEEISEHMNRGQMVIIETTLPPTVTRDQMMPILDRVYTVGKDIGLVYSPERSFSGRVIEDLTENYPKIIGGSSKKCTEYAALFYNSICEKGTILMSSTTAAECVKVFKGVYRDVNIALAEELGTFTDRVGVDLDEIVNAANTEPACHIHRRGTGVGGHCIPVYPHFVMNVANGLGPLLMPITYMSRNLNKDTPKIIAKKIMLELNGLGKCAGRSSVVLLGLSYRANVKEHSNSPTIEIAKELKKYDVIVYINDPHYTPVEIKNIVPDSDEYVGPIEKFNKCDLIVVLAYHDEYKGKLDKFKNILDFTQSLGDYTVTQKDRKIKTGDYLNE